MDLHLSGKRVLITGASKGIGAAAAEAFAEEGCHLHLAARSGDQLKALADASAHMSGDDTMRPRSPGSWSRRTPPRVPPMPCE